MARMERDREDLLAEATALVQRVELAVAGWSEHVIAGFRRNGCGSVYFGPDEAYQFNTAGELRRAYRDGLLYKAERHKLARLTRERSAAEVVLVRYELSAEETAPFVRHMGRMLLRLRESLSRGDFSVIGEVPSGGDVVAKLARWLTTLPCDAIAISPHAR